MAAPPGLAKDLFEDMGRKVADAQGEGIDDGESKVVDEIETLCMNCHENGTTRLLLTKIPFFREVIIMSFDCPHCNFKNSEVTPAGEIQQRGCKYSFKVDRAADLNRQIVKSDTCIFRIEDIDLEIPPGRGQLSNVEGILSMVAEDLAQKQAERKEVIPEVYEQIQGIIRTLEAMKTGLQFPFAITVNDPAGNSWIEPSPDDKGGKYLRHEYARTPAQNEAIGLGGGDEEEAAEGDAPPSEIRPEYQASQMYPHMPAAGTNNVDDDEIEENQVYSFPATCPGCTKPCATKMKMVNIPHFKQVVLMSTVCEYCGYRSNEVKTGGAVPEKGRRITISVENKADLSRDILKSGSCAVRCPELNLEMEPGTLEGRFTTIEGILTQVRDDLRNSIFDEESGGSGSDSVQKEARAKWDAFFERIDKGIRGDVKFTLILEDPLAESYVQSFTAPEPDPQMTVEDYVRTHQEEEDLGLNDIKTEGYEEGQAREEVKVEEAKLEEAKAKAEEAASNGMVAEGG
ncbi:zf-ZPR1-domain-containing protein [Mytilinidion resinicola]|uniref:Zf-ZPR1-domain-containing protein n=1 Tax=Mytilinidion resinicola TaxID=574789 RepID=A0A6A6Y8A1_9PEZI|nr:zf-ZPR1-domain-containing protein [Mytilinidion resinicola]KAF2804920.1 zf-ZPR1-domain-containing protein [Mytilinidion resinicola]